MSWIDEHKRACRAAILIAVLAAAMGPWTFDVIFVPAEYTCSAPHVRLNSRFCGIPLPGTWLFRWMFGGLIDASGGLVVGTMPFDEWVRLCLLGLSVSLLLLPVVGTLLLILRGDRRRWRVLNVAPWGAATVIGLLIGVFNHPELFWVLWGLWLYIALAASALTLEVLTLMGGRRLSHDQRSSV